MRALLPYMHLLRPWQWSKNVFLFAGIVFGRKLGDPDALLAAILGFFLFSLVSSTVYILNDIKDRHEDRHHPRKCKRPLASGAVAVPTAITLALVVATIGIGGAYLLHRGFFLVCLVYLVLQFFYSYGLKHVALLDVIIIGVGFVLRAVAGAVLVMVPISHWLVICTFTLCLFMGFSKRRCEINTLTDSGSADTAARHRRTLSVYTTDLLNHMTTTTAGIAVVSFMLYATDRRTIDVFGTYYLIYTLPMVVYAVFRFALLVEHGRVDGPTDVMLRDRPFQIALGLWTAAALAIVYRGPEIQAWLSAFVNDAG